MGTSITVTGGPDRLRGETHNVVLFSRKRVTFFVIVKLTYLSPSLLLCDRIEFSNPVYYNSCCCRRFGLFLN